KDRDVLAQAPEDEEASVARPGRPVRRALTGLVLVAEDEFAGLHPRFSSRRIVGNPLDPRLREAVSEPEVFVAAHLAWQRGPPVGRYLGDPNIRKPLALVRKLGLEVLSAIRRQQHECRN